MTTTKQWIPFHSGGDIYLASPAHIIRLEALSNYTCIHFVNHKPILMAKVLRQYEVLLKPFGFIRTHRSHLVNQQLIQRVDARGRIIMQDQSLAEISRRKKRIVFAHLLNPVQSAA